MNEEMLPAICSRTETLAQERDLAMSKFEQGMQLIAEASALAGRSLFDPQIMKPNAFGLPESMPRSIELGRIVIDTAFWKKVFSETQLERYWNHRKRNEFHEQLRNNPPLFSLGILRDTLRETYRGRRQALAEGFVDLLTGLDKKFKRNAVNYTMPDKFILRGVFEGLPSLRWNGFHEHNISTLRDFENIICVCIGIPTPGLSTDMADRLNKLRQEEGTGDVINEHGWRCRLCANGNVHISIDDSTLLTTLNDLISIYFAGQLPQQGQ